MADSNNPIIFEVYYDENYTAWYQARDAVTNQKIGSPKRDIFEVGFEKVNTSKISQVEQNKRFMSRYRREGLIEDALQEYIVHGKKLPILEPFLFAFEQQFPAGKGWELKPGFNLWDDKYVGHVGAVAANKLTGAVNLFNFTTPPKNKLLADAFTDYLQQSYKKAFPGSDVQGTYLFNAQKHLGYVSNYSLYKGQHNPYALKKVYGLGRFQQRRIFTEKDDLEHLTLDTSGNLFPKASKNSKYTSVFTVFDTETEDTLLPGSIGRPVEINAKKFGLLPNGRLELIDTYERYYKGRLWGMGASATHGYTAAQIEKLQQLNNQYVGEEWNTYRSQRDDDWQRSLFLQFVEGPLLGHNIVNFDFEAIGLTKDELHNLYIDNGVIDTLQLMRNFREDNIGGKQKSNELQKIFPEFIGSTTESFGIKAHGAGGDVTALGLLIQEWINSGTQMGDVLKALLTSPLTMNLYTAKRGKSTDALGNMFFDSKGNQYTVEELLYMAGATNNTPSLPGTGIDTMFSAIQELSKQVNILSSTVVGSVNALSTSKSAAESEYRALSNTIAATHTGDMEKAREAALRTFPGDLELQKTFIQSGGYPELVKKGVIRQLELIDAERQKSRFAPNQDPNEDPDIKALQASWDFADSKSVIESYNASLKDPMAHIDSDGNVQLGERYPVVENGWFDRFKLAEQNGLKSGKGLLGKATAVRANVEKTAGDALHEFNRPTILQDDAAWEKHLNNLRTESSLWEKIDQHALRASLQISGIAGDLFLPAAQRSAPWQAAVGQAHSIGRSLSWLPFNLGQPVHRIANAAGNIFSAQAARLDYEQAKTTAIGSAIGGIGSVVGGAIMPANPLLGLGVSGAANGVGNLVSRIPGGGWATKRAMRDVIVTGQTMSSSFNMYGALFDFVKMPFQLIGPLLGNAVKLLHVPFKSLNASLKLTTRLFHKLGRLTALPDKFIRLLSVLDTLNVPFTPLTNVSYGHSYRLNLLDSGLGLQRGTINKGYNSWASAQQNLFTLGQVDTNRLISSAMLGVFSDVYANGGDTTKQYASVVNKLANDIEQNPSRKQRIMSLAESLSPSMQTELSMLTTMRTHKRYRNLTYEEMMSGNYWGISTTSDAGKNKYQPRFYAARFGINATRQELAFQGQRIAVSAWEQIGQPIANSLIKSLRQVVSYVENGQWGKAFEFVKNTLKGYWTQFTKWSTPIIKTQWDKALSYIRKYPLASDILDSLGEVVNYVKQGEWGKAFEFAKEKVSEYFTKFTSWVIPKIIPIAQKMISAMEPYVMKIVDVWSELTKKLLHIVIDAIGSMSTLRIDTTALLNKARGKEGWEDVPIVYQAGKIVTTSAYGRSAADFKNARAILTSGGFSMVDSDYSHAVTNMGVAAPLFRAFFEYGGTEATLQSKAFQDAVGAAYSKMLSDPDPVTKSEAERFIREGYNANLQKYVDTYNKQQEQGGRLIDVSKSFVDEWIDSSVSKAKENLTSIINVKIVDALGNVQAEKQMVVEGDRTYASKGKGTNVADAYLTASRNSITQALELRTGQ